MRTFAMLMSVALCFLASTSTIPAPNAPEQPWKSVIHSTRDSITGANSLRINGFLLQQTGKPREFTFLSLWQYDVGKKKWQRIVTLRDAQPVTLKPEKRDVYSPKTDRELVRLPDQIGLYWAEWKEDGRITGTLVFSGSILCNDIQIGDPPKGMIATCVPFADRAEAMFVPDPKVHCRE